MFHIKKNDKVKILSGKDKGKIGEVLKCYPEKNKIIVAKINFIKRHVKATQSDPGGVREKESPLNISNVQVVCAKCNQASRIKMDWLTDGQKVRICKKCGEIIT
ncbi:50S ribosomal protein L24 [bacterium]